MKKDPVVEERIQFFEDDEERKQIYLRKRSNDIISAFFDSICDMYAAHKESAVFPSLHILNLMKYEVGVEVGVSLASSTCTILEFCESLKTLHCIDRYTPYIDYYSENYEVDKFEINIIKNIAFKNITQHRNKHKVKFYEEDSDITVEKFKDGELDFVFLDAHLNAEHIRKDLEKWYPKVRSGGLIMVHDTIFPTVPTEIKEYLESIDFKGSHSNIQNLCCILKN